VSREENEKPQSYSKWNKREMSSFVAQELLYDYMKGFLDESRRNAVESDLSENPITKKKHQQMMKGFAYLEKLRSVEVQPFLIEQIDEPSTYLSVLLKKSQFEKWPQSLKWGIEAFVVLMGIALFLIVTPWDKAIRLVILPQNQQVILAEVQKDPRSNNSVSLSDIEKNEKPQFSDDKKDGKGEAATEVVVASNEKPAALPPTPQPSTEKNVPAAKPVPIAAATGAATGASADPKKQPEISAADKKTPSGGFLFRGQFNVTNVEMIAPKLKEKIIALGGRKAGEVEIGWKKSDTTYYYHFTIPEAKFEELNEYFKTYEDPHMVKEKHPRVMPDGILRLILTVEEKRK